MVDIAETQHSSPARLELTCLVPASADEVWHAFVDPSILTTWWADEASAEAVVGGVIEARWPRMGWTMRGRYTELDPGRTVAFTWAWEHEPAIPERTVRITLAATNGGTRMTVSHGDYAAGDAEERVSHLEGWRHFLPRLAAALGA